MFRPLFQYLILLIFFMMGWFFFEANTVNNFTNNSANTIRSDSINDVSKYSVKIVPNINYIHRSDIIVLSNETGYMVYKIEDAYEYFDDEIEAVVKNVDLDKDGCEETICYGNTGGNGGFEEIFIFDFKRSIKPVYSVWSMNDDEIINEIIFIDNGDYINILAKQTAGFSRTKKLFYYPLKYLNGILIFPHFELHFE